MGLLKTLLIGRENGIRSMLRKTLFGGASVDTSPDSAYSAPTYTPPAPAPAPSRPEPPRDTEISNRGALPRPSPTGAGPPERWGLACEARRGPSIMMLEILSLLSPFPDDMFDVRLPSQ